MPPPAIMPGRGAPGWLCQRSITAGTHWISVGARLSSASSSGRSRRALAEALEQRAGHAARARSGPRDRRAARCGRATRRRTRRGRSSRSAARSERSTIASGSISACARISSRPASRSSGSVSSRGTSGAKWTSACWSARWRPSRPSTPSIERLRWKIRCRRAAPRRRGARARARARSARWRAASCASVSTCEQPSGPPSAAPRRRALSASSGVPDERLDPRARIAAAFAAGRERRLERDVRLLDADRRDARRRRARSPRARACRGSRPRSGGRSPSARARACARRRSRRSRAPRPAAICASDTTSVRVCAGAPIASISMAASVRAARWRSQPIALRHLRGPAPGWRNW